MRPVSPILVLALALLFALPLSVLAQDNGNTPFQPFDGGRNAPLQSGANPPTGPVPQQPGAGSNNTSAGGATTTSGPSRSVILQKIRNDAFQKIDEHLDVNSTQLLAQEVKRVGAELKKKEDQKKDNPCVKNREEEEEEEEAGGPLLKAVKRGIKPADLTKVGKLIGLFERVSEVADKKALILSILQLVTSEVSPQASSTDDVDDINAAFEYLKSESAKSETKLKKERIKKKKEEINELSQRIEKLKAEMKALQESS